MRALAPFALFVACMLAACAHAPAAFGGRETSKWLSLGSERIDKPILGSFAASAKKLGCSVEGLSKAAVPRPIHDGYEASCAAGTIAIVTIDDAHVYDVGCLKPTTTERCSELLRSVTSRPSDE